MVLQLLTEKEQEILSFLAKHSGKSAFQISVELRVTQSTVYKALNRLAREGFVKAHRSEGAEIWSIVSQKEFREIFIKEVEELAAAVFK